MTIFEGTTVVLQNDFFERNYLSFFSLRKTHVTEEVQGDLEQYNLNFLELHLDHEDFGYPWEKLWALLCRYYMLLGIEIVLWNLTTFYRFIKNSFQIELASN